MKTIDNLKRNVDLFNHMVDYIKIQTMKLDGIEVKETPDQIAFREYMDKLNSADKKTRIGFY